MPWGCLGRILADKSPDDALKAVVGAANESLNATDGAAVKAALLGRSYTGLGGFANLTTDEITGVDGFGGRQRRYHHVRRSGYRG